MSILFVIGVQIILNGDKSVNIEDLDPNEEFAIIYFTNDEMSKIHSNEISKKLKTNIFISINNLFKTLPDNLYTLRISEYIVHIKKYNKNCVYSFMPLEAQIENIYTFVLKHYNFQSLFFKIKNTEWNLPVFCFYLHYYTPLIIVLLSTSAIFVSCNNIYFEDLDYKIYLANLIDINNY